MSFFDFFKRRKAGERDQADTGDLSSDEFEQSKQHYGQRLADAFESVACQRLMNDDPTIESLLRKSGLMPHVDGWPMPSSAIVFPMKHEDNQVVYGYAWDLIESMSKEELGLELIEQVRRDRASGKIG